MNVIDNVFDSLEVNTEKVADRGCNIGKRLKVRF